MELTLHVHIDNIPDDYFMDVQYCSTEDFVREKLQEIADGLEGRLRDVEVK